MNDTGAHEEQGILVIDDVVLPEWIDCNGHMNVAYYLLAFDKGVDALWTMAGITNDYIQTRKKSTFAVEAHVTYQQEMHEREPYHVRTQILAIDDKRIHQFQRMYHAERGYLAATAEFLNLHVNLDTRRVCPWPDDILASFTALAESQPEKTIPLEMGKTMQVKRPLFSLSKYVSDAPAKAGD